MNIQPANWLKNGEHVKGNRTIVDLRDGGKYSISPSILSFACIKG